MPDNKSISQLTTAEQTTSSDLFETSIPNGSLGYLSRKVSLDTIADYIGNDHLFSSDLQTTDKTLTGAINEAAQSGGGASIEEMTMAQYNALTPEQKADGTLRAISDATTSISDIDNVNISSVADGDALIYDSTSSKWINKELEADAVAYDNTSSGLTATDVNAAIDEVVDDGYYHAGDTIDIAGVYPIHASTTLLFFDIPISRRITSNLTFTEGTTITCRYLFASCQTSPAFTSQRNNIDLNSLGTLSIAMVNETKIRVSVNWGSGLAPSDNVNFGIIRLLYGTITIS